MVACGNMGGHQSSVGTTAPTTSDSGGVESLGAAWKIGEFVDEFDRPIGQKYLSVTVLDGKFSNSATTNSKLYAVVQVTSSDIGIMLSEYGNQIVKGIYDSTEYEITVLDQSGRKHYFRGVLIEGSTRIYFNPSDRATLLGILQKSGSISIYLKNSKYTTSEYLFTIPTDGFSTLYPQIR